MFQSKDDFFKKRDFKNITKDDLVNFKKYLTIKPQYQKFIYDLIKKSIENNNFTYFEIEFVEMFELFSISNIKEILFVISKKEFGDLYLLKIIKNIQNKTILNDILLFIGENDFTLIKNVNYIEEIYLNNIFRIELIAKNGIKNFFLLLNFGILNRNQDINNRFVTLLVNIIKEYREFIFSIAKNKVVSFVEELINIKDKLLLEEQKIKIDYILEFDLWDYSETVDELKKWFYEICSIILNKNADYTHLFKQLNQISNNTFKKFDSKMNNFILNIKELSYSLYDENTQFDINKSFDPLEAMIIKKTLYKLFVYYSQNKQINENLSIKLLNLTMDEDVKDRKVETKENEITPLSDVDEIYDSKTSVSFEEKEEKAYSTQKKEPKEEISEVLKENKEVVKVAIDIIKEIGRDFDIKEIQKEKESITDMVKEMLKERRKINEEKNIRIIIDEAIKEVLTEKNFEDL
ncbi:MAG: hypothetical protein A2086_11690 [Spirochaetes bacterium GWD1_27_9]|nr:MAG: hypothetical protein A2Y34_05555 [Spirochaetes bacterium GWC1_27_15]OHD28625.1 MAG: hypothetical protein A2086_11690 [Spirochaetes bacterium GWD1_27_9]